MLKESQAFLATNPWNAVLPGSAIATTVLRLTLLGDRLRDLLDSKLSGQGQTLQQAEGDPYVPRVLLASVMPLAVTQAAAIAASVPLHRGLAPRTLCVQRPWMSV